MKNKKIIIGLIGEKGSGKGTVSNYLVEKYGAKHYGTSKILKRTVEALHLPITRDNFIKLALVLKEGFYPSVLMDSLIQDIEQNGSDIIIADGIRMHGDIEPFKEKYGDNFYLMYVTADIAIRYERTRKRKEKAGEGEATFEEFLREEGRLTEVSIHELGEKADFILDNNGAQDDLIKQTEEAMKKIIKNK